MKNNQGTWLKYTNFKWNETKIWIKDKFFHVIQIFLLSQSLLCHYYKLVNMIITNVYLFYSATYYDLSMGWYFRPSYYSYDRFRQICGWRHTNRKVFIGVFFVLYISWLKWPFSQNGEMAQLSTGMSSYLQPTVTPASGRPDDAGVSRHLYSCEHILTTQIYIIKNNINVILTSQPLHDTHSLQCHLNKLWSRDYTC